MRARRAGRGWFFAALVASYAVPALGQARPDPMEGVTPAPSAAPAPSTTSTTVYVPAPPPTESAPPAPPPPPPSAQTPAPPPAKDAPAEERKTLWSIGVGPTLFLMAGQGSSPRWSSPGVALQGGARVPFDENLGLGVRFAWGLTEFRRFGDFAHAGYEIGKWTTQAYSDVYDWAAEPGDTKSLRVPAAFIAMVFLWIPYFAAGVLYALAPFATTTYLETDLTLQYDFGSDKRATGPYLKGGVGLVGFLHPKHDTLLGGLGPTLGAGIRAGNHFDIGINGTWLPPFLHGDTQGEQSNIFITNLALGFY